MAGALLKTASYSFEVTTLRTQQQLSPWDVLPLLNLEFVKFTPLPKELAHHVYAVHSSSQYTSAFKLVALATCPNWLTHSDLFK